MIFRRAPLISALLAHNLPGVGVHQDACTPTRLLEYPGQFQVDPVFRAFYNYHGGEERLGKAISPPRKEGSATIQFLESGKLVFDPNAPRKQQIPHGADWAGDGC